MKKLFTFFVLLALLVFKGYSQTARQVHGIIADSTGITVPGAVVKLTSPTDSLNVVTNIDGVFTFGSVKAKKFSLTIQSIGFQGLKRNYTFDDDTKPANIGMIKLKAESRLLGVVNIVDVNAVKIKEDTTEYKASAYPVRANASAEEIIKKLPGVDVDASGNVTAEGKSVTKVRINGKDFFGGDVQTATKNLPADVIESIQMIDDYGDQANLTGIKSGEPNKIMNIVIRKDKNYGYSLSATGGDGADAQPHGVPNDNRYVGSVNAFNFKGDQQIAVLGSINNTNVNTFSFGGSGGGGGFGGGGGGGRGNAARGGGGGGATSSSPGITDAHSLGLNFRDQWGKNLSVYGSYSFADNTVNTISNNTQINLSSPSTTNVSNSNETDRNTNHRLTWNMEWKPDTVNYFKFTPTFSYSGTTAQSDDNNIFTRQLNATSASQSTYLSYLNTNYSTSTSPSYGLNVLYNHRFNGNGRNFSVNLTGNTGTSESYQNPIYHFQTGRLNTPANQLINVGGKNNSIGATFSYIEPLGKINYLEATYAYNRSYNENNKQTDTLSNNVPVFWSDLSNNYNYTFTTNRFALNYRVVDKKYNYTIGLGIQPSTLSGFSPATATQPSVVTNVSTVNFSPTARYIYNFSRTQALSFNYNGNSNQPSYSQLNPRLDVSNAFYPVQGNPGLKPEFNNNFSLRYNQFSFNTGNLLFSNISFTQTQNKIIANKVIYPTLYTPDRRLSGTQATEYSNSNGYYSGNGFFTFAKPWQQRKYTLIFNGNISYTNSNSYIDTITSVTYARTRLYNTAKTLALTPGVRFRLDIQDVVDAQINTNYSINKTNNSLTGALANANSNYRTLTIGLNGKNYFWTNWTLSYDYTKKVYQGYVGATNPNILNAYVERRFLKNNAATIRLAAYDLFNQNTSFTSTTTPTQTTSTQSNSLGRYFLATLTIRLQKFAGKTPDDFPGGKRRGFGGGGGPGGGGPGGGGFGGPPQ